MRSDLDVLREQLVLVTAQKEEFERLAQKRSVELATALDELAEAKKERDQFETRLLHATEVQAIRRKKLHAKVEEIKKALTEKYAENVRLRLAKRIAESFKEMKLAAQIERDVAIVERDAARAERDTAVAERNAAIAKGEHNKRVLIELSREGKVPSCPECGANAGWTDACCEVCSERHAKDYDKRVARLRRLQALVPRIDALRKVANEAEALSKFLGPHFVSKEAVRLDHALAALAALEAGSNPSFELSEDESDECP